MDKYRYVFKCNDNFKYQVLTLDQIQNGEALEVIKFWRGMCFDLISRDRWTGVVDENKRDIYEKDNIRFTSFMEKYHGTVILRKGCFIVTWESIVGAYGEKATHSKYLKECDDIEVVGTTHEKGENEANGH